LCATEKHAHARTHTGTGVFYFLTLRAHEALNRGGGGSFTARWKKISGRFTEKGEEEEEEEGAEYTLQQRPHKHIVTRAPYNEVDFYNALSK